ncbi:hypothetical protein ACFXAZ_34290 [Streptomyces sp. NPDC059477]|uniref:hypothetical protein n=1 Tax=Streptomyces sp. NPDC059477 TaxID=3346847 RepID=UPI0036B294DA
MSDEQYQEDLERASDQNSFADLARAYEEPRGGGLFNRLVSGAIRTTVGATKPGQAVFGSTDFGGTGLGLNQLRDLVEQANPEDLEGSGKALWDARDAIMAAAKDLEKHVGTVSFSWMGEAAGAFTIWSKNLVTSARELSEFAGSAGDEISAAAVGLASVRSAMPPRDPANRKRPEQYSETEKAANKEEYEDAVRVERDRQEAINQMNRLASYYSVSHQQLRDLVPPTFNNPPTVDVPRPQRESGAPESGPGESVGQTPTRTYTPPADENAGRTGADAPGATSRPPAEVNAPVEVNARVTDPGEPVRKDIEEPPVRTNIDGVDTLTPPATTTTTGPAQPATGNPPVNSTGPFGPYGPVSNSAIGRTSGTAAGGRTSGISGSRAPLSAQGRPTSGPLSPGSGSGTARGSGPASPGMFGRPGQPGATGPASGSRGSFPMGQGITGGTPRPGGTPSQRPGAGPTTGAGRAHGVVGGQPTNTGGTSNNRNGSRIPRGTVIGSNPVNNARSAPGGQPGQRGGVFGAPSATNRPGPGTNPRGGRGTPPPVTGSPSARNSASGAERNGMTRGGSGLVRGPATRRRPDDERDQQGTPRPDYVVEDEETHLPNRPRRDVPPVVN